MDRTDQPKRKDRAVDQAAAEWVARRDRGLTAREQDDYLEWLQADSRRGAMIARHEATLRRMQGLAQWQPALSREANPDLFAPRRRRRWWVIAPLAAAAVVGGLLLSPPRPGEARLAPPPAAPGHYLRLNEHQTLADGSTVELREGTQLALQFSAGERRVRLTGGEAHFRVAKDPARPFIVDAAGVAVRAVGTAFNVRLDATAVDVLVTQGRVSVEAATPAPEAPGAHATPVLVAANQRTVVPLTPAPTPSKPAVVTVTPEQVQEVLAWQAPRLQFHETPLAEAIAEFNRHNRHRLILGEPALGTIPIGGTFRVDNVDGFVRLLEVTLGIRGEARGPEQTVLTRLR